MDVRAVDRSAVPRRSRLHRASATAKLVALGLVLAAVIVSWNSFVLAAVALSLVAACAASRVDLRLALGLAGYPALFAAVFALASAPSPLAGVTIMLKAVTAALAAVTLVLTTPYPEIFAKVQPVMPGLAGDALLMTYRTFFLLAERFSDMLRAVRLRSGTGPGRAGIVRTARLVGSALSSLVLYAIELAERDYDILYVRGYAGRMRAAHRPASSFVDDALVYGVGAVLAAVAVLWRVSWAALNPFSWLPLAAAAVILVVSLVWRSVSDSYA